MKNFTEVIVLFLYVFLLSKLQNIYICEDLLPKNSNLCY